MSAGSETKAAVTVAEMARMCGLSRARFYQLMGSVFPEPSRSSETGRPFYTEAQQRVCLDVRRRNCGINGQPILFYTKGTTPTAPKPRSKKSRPKTPQHTELVEAVRSLGLTSANASQVNVALKEACPDGADNMDQGEVIRAVFIHLQRQNSTDKVG